MQKGFAPIIFLVGILILAGVAGGIFYVGRLTAPKQSQPRVITSETNKPTLTPATGESSDSALLKQSRLFSGYSSYDFGEPKVADVLIQDGSDYGPPFDPDLYQLEVPKNYSYHLFAKSDKVNLKQYLGKAVKVSYREVKGIVMTEQQLVIVDSVELVPNRKIKLYYYNKTYDPKLDCLESAVASVDREIFITKTPIQDTMKLLVEGLLTAEEKKAGFSTEFSHPPSIVLGANLKNGILTLDFYEIPGFWSGGSCRMILLKAQVEKTAMQFQEVKEVKYKNPAFFEP